MTLSCQSKLLVKHLQVLYVWLIINCFISSAVDRTMYKSKRKKEVPCNRWILIPCAWTHVWVSWLSKETIPNQLVLGSLICRHSIPHSAKRSYLLLDLPDNVCSILPNIKLFSSAYMMDNFLLVFVLMLQLGQLLVGGDWLEETVNVNIGENRYMCTTVLCINSRWQPMPQDDFKYCIV